MQKAPRVWQRVLALRCLWSVFLLGLCAPSCGFGQPKQEPLSSVRERFGRQRPQTNAASTVSNFVKLSQHEKKLLDKISSAGKKRKWQAVKDQISSYRGDGVPLYNAAMHAAIRCQAYQEGALIYERCRKHCTVYQEPTFAAALRISEGPASLDRCVEPRLFQHRHCQQLTVAMLKQQQRFWISWWTLAWR